MKQIAIIAPTASGKTALSIKLAHETDSIIVSLDSLAIYKQIDIASAKPTLEERDGIIHFGIDEIYPDEKFDVIKFIDIYNRAKQYALSNNKNLIIVGGSSFYLKMMIDGISPTPTITKEQKSIIDLKIQNNSTNDLHKFLYNIDEKYMKNIKINDSYRIQKALEIYISTNQKPSIYFTNNKAVPIIQNINIYEISWAVDELRDRIRQRTKIMINDGLINEVIFLEKKYKRDIAPMNSIGIKEALEYIDGKINKNQLEEKIVIATAQLAKRQRTFNKGQFSDVCKLPLDLIYNKITKFYLK